MPFIFRALSQIPIPIAIQNAIFDHRRQFILIVVCCFFGMIWLFCSVSDETVGVFFSKIKSKRLFLRILLLETEFYLLVSVSFCDRILAVRAFAWQCAVSLGNIDSYA